MLPPPPHFPTTRISLSLSLIFILGLSSTMKQNSLTLVLLSLLFLLIITTTSARKQLGLADKHGEIKYIKIIDKSAAQTQNLHSFTVDLLGMEDCENEECVKRRALAEAHLDYIYTQHHKP